MRCSNRCARCCRRWCGAWLVRKNRDAESLPEFAAISAWHGVDSAGAVLPNRDRADVAEDVPILSQLQRVFHPRLGEARPVRRLREGRVADLPLWAVDQGGVRSAVSVRWRAEAPQGPVG